MTALILGANGSGKSVYAEKLAAKISEGRLFYIATMIPYGEEGTARIEKHRKQRGFAEFITIEKYSDISEINLPENSTVLLEDVSNLLGNTIFGKNKGTGIKDVFKDITAICSKCLNSVLVSIDGLAVSPEYDCETNGFISSLNTLNLSLRGIADTVIKMKNGIPEFIR